MSQGFQIHFWLELSAYFVGAQWYRLNLKRQPADMPRLDVLQRWAVIAGALFGAAVGSKLLYVLQYWHALQAQPFIVWMSGKTVAGALLGGLLGVESAKWLLGWRRSTGDAFVWPLLFGMVIGRVGCQLAGLEDLTYGGVTTLPWGWNYGDGVLRHPVALYEVLGLLLLALLLRRYRAGLLLVSGDRFRAFMLGYLLLRVLLDFLKPPHVPVAAGQLAPSLYGPFSAIQWACVAGLVYYAPTLRRWLARQHREA